MVMRIYGAAATNVERALLPLFEAENTRSTHSSPCRHLESILKYRIVTAEQVDVDIELELELVDMLKREHKKPAYLAKQPFGLVPCFEDGDLLLLESRAIARYLAEKYQNQGVPLLGKTLEERAIINQWCEVESQTFNTVAAALIREMYMSSLEKRPINEEYLDSCKSKLEAILDVYDVQLSRNKFIAGNTYSLADALHIPLLNRLLNKKNEVFTGRKHVLAWAQTLNSRPSYTKTQELNSKWSKLKALKGA